MAGVPDEAQERRAPLRPWPGWLLLGLTVFVSVSTDDHSPQWRERFATTIAGFPEVMDLYRMAGEVDYMMRVVVRDMAAYDAFYKRLIAKIEIHDVSSAFAMEQIKYTTELPLDYMLMDKESGSSGMA